MEKKTDRRTLLKLGLAAAIGAFASAIKIPKAKAEGETVVVGGEYTTATSPTVISGKVTHSILAYPVIGGFNKAPSGQAYGLWGSSESTSGTGVAGWAVASEGTTIGVCGGALSESGCGVAGGANADWGTTCGVYGWSKSTSGYGVKGYATATTGSTKGVFGRVDSTSGRGVFGLHAATSGEGYGLFGRTESPSGYALKTVGRSTFGGHVLPTSDNAYNCGSSSRRWKLVRAVTITPGDLVFENSFKVTEDEKAGLAFKNDVGEKIAVLDREGNLHIKGDVIKDL